MCAALEEMKMDNEIKGFTEAYREIDFSLQDTIERAAQKFSLSWLLNILNFQSGWPGCRRGD